MRVGVYGAAGAGWLDDVVDGARRAADDGFHTFWLGQAFGIDALTALAVAARHGIELLERLHQPASAGCPDHQVIYL